MKRVLQIIFGIFEFVLITFAIFMVGVVFLRNQFGYTEFAGNTLIIIDDYNITELPHYKSGDLVVIRSINYNDVQIGDELYYYDTLNDAYIVRTGTVKTKTGDNRSSLYTFEENDRVSIASDRILGIYGDSHSGWGSILSFLTSTVGFLIFVILPILVLFIYHIYHLVMILKYDE